METLGITYSHVSLILSFKANKVKKATLVSINTKLQTGKFVDSKIVSYHLVRCYNALFVQRTLYSKKDIWKAMYTFWHFSSYNCIEVFSSGNFQILISKSGKFLMTKACIF